MPYVECPGCGLSLYSAASHFWAAEACQGCGASLAGATKRLPPAVAARTLCREFPSTPGAVSSARHALDGVYAELGEAIHMTAALLVSELVTNSVKHSKVGNGVIELMACITPSVVRVEVSDDGPGFVVPRAADDAAASGRGLRLVRALADRWGRPTGERTSVWFELDRTPGDARDSTLSGVPAPTTTPGLRLAT